MLNLVWWMNKLLEWGISMWKLIRFGNSLLKIFLIF